MCAYLSTLECIINNIINNNRAYENLMCKTTSQVKLLQNDQLIFAPTDDEECIKKAARFEVGAFVQCNVGQWARGRVVAHKYVEPESGLVHPYQIKLQDGRLIYASEDDDACIQTVTFAVGERVHVHGISNNPQYNGLIGVIVKVQEGRLRVALENSGKELSLTVEKLQPVEEETLDADNAVQDNFKNRGNVEDGDNKTVGAGLLSPSRIQETQDAVTTIKKVSNGRGSPKQPSWAMPSEGYNPCGCGCSSEDQALMREILISWRQVNAPKISFVSLPLPSLSVLGGQDIVDLTGDDSESTSTTKHKPAVPASPNTSFASAAALFISSRHITTPARRTKPTGRMPRSFGGAVR